MTVPFSRYAWLDKRYVLVKNATVPITTHAIHYGTCIFEGVRAYWNGSNLNVFRLDDHIARLRRSGRFYDMSLRFSDAEITAAVTGICKKNKLKESCYIRPFYFVGEYGINLHVTDAAPTSMGIVTFPFGELFDRNGISATVVSWRKFSGMSTPVQSKISGNYLNSVIATQEAKSRGADEAILLDHCGNVSEAAGENIFIVRGGQLVMPSHASDPLEGITRDTVARMAADMDIDVIQRTVTRDELLMADEIFLTGTAAEIVPITSVDSFKIGGSGSGSGKPGEITCKIKDGYMDMVMGRNPDYPHWLTEVY